MLRSDIAPEISSALHFADFWLGLQRILTCPGVKTLSKIALYFFSLFSNLDICRSFTSRIFSVFFNLRANPSLAFNVSSSFFFKSRNSSESSPFDILDPTSDSMSYSIPSCPVISPYLSEIRDKHLVGIASSFKRRVPRKVSGSCCCTHVFSLNALGRKWMEHTLPVK